MNIFALFGMEGLIKANLKAYFKSIGSGVDHKDALMIVLKSRYPFQPGKREEVELNWEGKRTYRMHFGETKPLMEREKDELRDLIYTMFLIETHLDRADMFKQIEEEEKFNNKFNKLYDSMKTKYL